MLSLALSLLWTVFGLYILALLWWNPAALPLPVPPAALGDALTVAAQLGRLDLIALALTVLAVVIAVAALAGFWMVRREAIARAEEEARSTVTEVAPGEVECFLTKNGQALVAETLRKHPFLLARGLQATSQLSDMAPGVADDVAARFDGDEDG